jgi:UDP-N-acetyl-alpha-D-muramoyl-L-alanyl-L-glutamate epimerase
MSQFIFERYAFDPATAEASFHYRFDDGRSFVERVQFEAGESYNTDALERALQLAFLVIGTSYYKTFPTREVRFDHGAIDEWQAGFLSRVYSEGLSQFAYENQLTRADLPSFSATIEQQTAAVPYSGDGKLVLQSGGKDSLLVASLLRATQQPFTPWYLTSSDHHPAVLDTFATPLAIARRQIDREALLQALHDGGKNGHVPVTYIVQSIALIQAILLAKAEVLVSIAHEGEEPHAFIGDLPVTHQWSKTWQAEQLFVEYVRRYISPDLRIGSPLRQYSELKVAALFVQYAWREHARSFSSCNRANYAQGNDNSQLKWCTECPKCANSFLLFAPFVEPAELRAIFNGQDLFTKPMLQQTFKGLLGVDGVMKPFECVGEIDELRTAYHMAQQRGGYGQVSFAVPAASFDLDDEYPSQDWARL